MALSDLARNGVDVIGKGDGEGTGEEDELSLCSWCESLVPKGPASCVDLDSDGSNKSSLRVSALSARGLCGEIDCRSRSCCGVGADGFS